MYMPLALAVWAVEQWTWLVVVFCSSNAGAAAPGRGGSDVVLLAVDGSDMAGGALGEVVGSPEVSRWTALAAAHGIGRSASKKVFYSFSKKKCFVVTLGSCL